MYGGAPPVEDRLMRALTMAIVLTLAAGGCGGTDPPPPPVVDMASALSSSDMLKPFGQSCMANAECMSSICFIGGMRSYCSLKCTTATAAKDCPVPPTTGACNMQGFCKAP